MTGASGDLQNATRLAGAYIAMYGMNGSLYSNLAFNESTPDPKLKREIERLLDQQFAKVKSFLDMHHDEVVAIAEELLEKEDLTGDDVIAILSDLEQRKRIAAATVPTNGAIVHGSSEPAL
jgi:cell division protease FtsH